MDTQSKQKFPTETLQPSITENATLVPHSSAPKDETTDLSCRITINFFFSFKEGSDIEGFRNLFTPSSRQLADAVEVRQEPLIILALMPASEWWQKEYSTTPIPGTLLQEFPNEYTYYVEYSGYYESYATPFYAYPDFMIFTMVVDGPYSCKIKGYGKG